MSSAFVPCLPQEKNVPGQASMCTSLFLAHQAYYDTVRAWDCMHLPSELGYKGDSVRAGLGITQLKRRSSITGHHFLRCINCVTSANFF